MTEKRITSLLFIILALWLKSYGQDFSEAVSNFIDNNGIKPESVAVKVIDLSDGKTIASHNTSSPLVPASIMKSVTTAALLDKTGIDFCYNTPVYIDGPLDMGILRGNLIVEGACDPSLNSTNEPGSTDIISEIIDALRKAGINRIEGDIIIDESDFSGPARPASWMPADFSQSYGTGSHAFNFEDNSSGKRSVENPGYIFKTRLKSRLRNEGISVEAKDLGEGKREKLMNHISAPIDEIMRSCMMRSDNLFAESMLRTYGKLDGGDGSTEDAASRELKLWKKKKMPLDDVVIIDGSGLSRSNRVTADFMGEVLSNMSGNPNYASFFPLAGQEGTLRRFLEDTPLDSYIAMKTGSMKGIQCYAGYKLDENYVPTHVVVIIMNDITGSRDKAKKAAEKMLLDIFDAHTEPEDPQNDE
ncbi:MAG: D-alanyl-D-alanine carboxypeptidase [Muribaculaceae bacterium]|nr:D-alanyl-D-alanine carboxypeptidase [Muribaculaceae bacterium]